MKRACSTSIIFGVCDVHQITFDSKVFFFFFFRYEYGENATAFGRRLNRVVCFRITSEIGRSKKNPKAGVVGLCQLRPNLLRYTVFYESLFSGPSLLHEHRCLRRIVGIGAEHKKARRIGMIYNNYWGRGQTSVCLSSYPLVLLYN